MKKSNLNYLRFKIMNESKKDISFNGWNEDLINLIAKKNNYKKAELKILFPNGYRSILEFYLDNLNKELTKSCKKIDLLRLKTHERIREIILTKILTNQKDKNLIKKTYMTLLMPSNYKLSINSLYKSVDQIWYIAGDNSTDFNFYTKRGLLAGIYISTILFWINGDKNIDEVESFLNNQLSKVSKIPKFKRKLKSLSILTPDILNFLRRFSILKQ